MRAASENRIRDKIIHLNDPFFQQLITSPEYAQEAIHLLMWWSNNNQIDVDETYMLTNEEKDKYLCILNNYIHRFSSPKTLIKLNIID